MLEVWGRLGIACRGRRMADGWNLGVFGLAAGVAARETWAVLGEGRSFVGAQIYGGFLVFHVLHDLGGVDFFCWARSPWY